MSKDGYDYLVKKEGPTTVGRLFSNHRSRNNMTQKDLAKKLGVTVGFISNIETGKKWISLDKLIEYCRKLGGNEIFWMIIWMKNEARLAGKEITSIIIEDRKRKRA